MENVAYLDLGVINFIHKNSPSYTLNICTLMHTHDIQLL